jgi:hypothetical protein
LFEKESTAEEDVWLQVRRIFQNETVRAMAGALRDYTTELVLDLDLDLAEVGISEWEHRQTTNGIILSTMMSQMVHHDVNNNLKH